MTIPHLTSIMSIERQFNTGDTPVLISCSDMNSYICKYKRTSGAAYKLVTELIGSTFAKAWKLASPYSALVTIKPEHWDKLAIGYRASAPAIGYRFLRNTVDITSSSYQTVVCSECTLYQLLQIALFDFWIANEDRTYNNPNLIYDITDDVIVSIDYGGALNTATYDYPMSQLTSTDTILYAGIFKHLTSKHTKDTIYRIRDKVIANLDTSILACNSCRDDIINNIPAEWGVNIRIVEDKMSQLFNPDWIKGCLDNFVECIDDNM